MIPNQWYPIFEARALKRRPTSIQRMGRDFVLFRGEDGRARCLLDRCSHRGAALSRGSVRGNDIQCPYHGLCFDGQGHCTRVPYDGPDAAIPAGLDIFAPPVEEQYGLIWMWWGGAPAALGWRELPPIPWFPELEEAGMACGFARVWPASHVRAAEGMLDFHHAKFVHGGVAPWLPARVGKIEVTDNDEGFELYGTLVPEPGTREREEHIWLKFRPPTLQLVKNGNMPTLCFIAADCPIDETTTWRYLRQYYKPKLRVPGLAKMGAWVMLAIGWHVIHKGQDLPIVRTQPRPREAHDRLLRPDQGIARYRQLRRRLLREALPTAEHQPPLVREAFLATLAAEKM